jgi:hypothetical protein
VYIGLDRGLNDGTRLVLDKTEWVQVLRARTRTRTRLLYLRRSDFRGVIARVVEISDACMHAWMDFGLGKREIDSGGSAAFRSEMR